MKWIVLLTFLHGVSYASSLPLLRGQNIIDESQISHDWTSPKLGTVIVFLSALCPCSNGHVDHLKELAKNNPEFDFIGIHSNANETKEEGKTYFQSKELSFKIIRDLESEWANRLKAYATPHAFVVDKSGELLYQGGVTSSASADRAEEFYLKDALLALKSGQKIKLAKTRVLGCKIAR
ncbi:MAG: redoxin family protein [Bacteriovoracaceae bacterium]